jgi:AraC-like DNA-binding protein
MALITVLTKDPKVRAAVWSPATDAHSVAATRSWERLRWLVRERPTTVAVLDAEAIAPEMAEDVAVGELRRRFPSMGILLVVRRGGDPVSLFRLGRAGLGSLVLLPADALEVDFVRAIRDALVGSTASLVTELAARLDLTRPHLSVRLGAAGLPSAGHLLIWAKLLHAARWLTDPGRSAESVSRQLEYSSGAAFRRALRTYLGVTPTELKGGGGLWLALQRFLDACGLGDSVVFDRSVA